MPDRLLLSEQRLGFPKKKRKLWSWNLQIKIKEKYTQINIHKLKKTLYQLKLISKSKQDIIRLIVSDIILKLLYNSTHFQTYTQNTLKYDIGFNQIGEHSLKNIDKAMIMSACWMSAIQSWSSYFVFLTFCPQLPNII